jgi:glutathione synthase
MRVGFLINDFATEKPTYTTVRLGMEAASLGHEAWFMGAGDFAYDVDGRIAARARSVKGHRFKSPGTFHAALVSDEAVQERIVVDDLDVLMLRNDPSEDMVERPWAQTAGLIFGRLAKERGVIVLNDPQGLANAMNKTYLQGFPEEVRPATLITRDPAEIKAFVEDRGDDVVIKPLQGSGGHHVFLVRPSDAANLNQMIETVCSEGYAICQEYLKAIEHGDIRLFLMNGLPLTVNGKYAAFRRLRSGGDVRSNVSAGGEVAAASIGDVELRLAEIVRPKLVEDGMFLVGLDIVGDKLMEINVFSPGGLGSAEHTQGERFARDVVHALERKVAHARSYRRRFDNREMATL